VSTGWAIFVMNADGSSAREIAHVGTVNDRLRWSPDGTRIAFSAYDISPSTPDRVWVVNADGTNARQVTTDANGGGTGTAPSWFPDNETILFNHAGLSRIG